MMKKSGLKWKLFQILKQLAFCHESIDSCPQQVQHNYKITSNVITLPAPVRVRIQHCTIVEKEDSLVLWWHMMALLTISSLLVNCMARLKSKNLAAHNFL